MTKPISVAMMTSSIDNIHTSNHFHMKFRIQIAPFYYCIFISNRGSTQPRCLSVGQRETAKYRRELPMPYLPSLCLHSHPHTHGRLIPWMARSWSLGKHWLRRASCHSTWIPTQWWHWTGKSDEGGRGERKDGGEQRRGKKEKEAASSFCFLSLYGKVSLPSKLQCFSSALIPHRTSLISYFFLTWAISKCFTSCSY